MVVGILANIVKIVVFTTSPNALLRVARTGEFAQGSVWVYRAQEDRLELIHTSIREKKGRVIERNDGAGFPVDMILALEEVKESLSDPACRPIRRRPLGTHGRE